MAKYKLTDIKSTKTGRASAHLVENGVLIAKITRGPNERYGTSLHCQPLTFKFFSSQSEMRFQDYADSISMEESAYAIGFPQPFQRN